MDDDRGSARLPVRDRESLPPAGARARRGGRAADVARQPPGVGAERRLLRRCRPPTRSSRRSRCRPARRSPSRTASTARILATRREQADREAAFTALHETYKRSLNTYATLYNGVCQRDWFQARARGYESTLDAALHGDNIPTSVVENLIETTRAGVAPLRRYHQLRRRVLERAVVPRLRLLDPARHLRQEVPATTKCSTGSSTRWRRSAPSTRRGCAQGFAGRWIDVYENEGKRSGAYSAPVYGTHPYMLLNYTDTLDDVFTLAHEMGHSMHTILSHETQPFVYSSYTIFVAEVPSTLSEALLLEYMLARSTDPAERIVLLQHAIDNITGTFYTQVMFADYELRAHRLAEQDQPITRRS